MKSKGFNEVWPSTAIEMHGGINVASGRSMNQLGAGLGGFAEVTGNQRLTASVRESAEGIGKLRSHLGLQGKIAWG